MRVCLDARMAGYTGIGRYVRLLARHVAALDACELLVLANPGDPLAWLPASPRVRPFLLPRRVPIFSWREQWTLPRTVRRLRPDVLHAPNWNAPFRAGLPLVVTFHDLIYYRFPESCPSWLSHRYARLAMGRLARRATRLIAVSAATRDETVREFGVDPARVRVVHHGPPLSGALPAAAAPESGKAPEILYVGTFAPHKNLPFLVDAVAALRAGGTDARLVVAGSPGRHGAAFEAAVARHGLEAALERIGAVDDDGLAALYRRARVLALPSRAEGFGFTPLEAFAFGCPVVASDIPPLREVAGDGAMLVPPGALDAWCDALRRVCTDPAVRADLTARGRARLAAFSWTRAAEETVAVYRDAAGAT